MPESANPNYETLKYYLYRYLYFHNRYPYCASDNKELHKVIGNGEIMEFIDSSSTQSEKNFYRIEASKDQ